MPTSFRYFRCPDLPQLDLGEEFRSRAQLAMPWGDHEASSSMKLLGVAEDERFDKYDVEHQLEREFEAFYNQTHIRRLIAVLRFSAYYNRHEGYFLVGAGKRESRTLFERLRDANPPVEAEPGELDLLQVQRMIGVTTTGGWFAKLDLADVRTAGIFGSESIGSSEEWAHYAELGEISAINVRVEDDDGLVTPVQITADRLVLVYPSHSERDNLRLVAGLNKLFDELEERQS